MRALLGTADRFSVPAAYVLYMGSVDFRASYTSHMKDPSPLERARKATVSVLAALLAQNSFTPRDGARAALNWSIPLEDLATSTVLGFIVDMVILLVVKMTETGPANWASLGYRRS
jgi:hypothetical protein